MPELMVSGDAVDDIRLSYTDKKRGVQFRYPCIGNLTSWLDSISPGRINDSHSHPAVKKILSDYAEAKGIKYVAA